MKEGRRGLGIGEESHDEVCPSEMANALPGIRICFLGDRHRSGFVLVGGDEDAWGVCGLSPDRWCGSVLVGLAASDGSGGSDRETKQGGGVLGGVACAGGVGGVFRQVGFVGDGSLWCGWFGRCVERGGDGMNLL